MQSVTFQIHLVNRNAAWLERFIHITKGSRQIVDMLQHRPRENHVDRILQSRQAAGFDKILDFVRPASGFKMSALDKAFQHPVAFHLR